MLNEKVGEILDVFEENTNEKGQISNEAATVIVNYFSEIPDDDKAQAYLDVMHGLASRGIPYDERFVQYNG
jgi:hypothetical protein